MNITSLTKQEVEIINRGLAQSHENAQVVRIHTKTISKMLKNASRRDWALLALAINSALEWLL
jgi:hypothetical protein